jgi:hypothetical protein
VGGTEFSLPMGEDDFDFKDTFMDEGSDFDFSESESNIEAADPEDKWFWERAAATMGLSAIPFLIGGNSAPTDHAVDAVDDVTAALNAAEMGVGGAGVITGVPNAPGAASGSSHPLQSPQGAQPSPSPQ